ncbi:MAG: hypothetical protein Q9O62_06135 [Ardenticatenia bacterium]|nr:hypothetical protein [Ardenticatenia bacterium]
MTTFYEDELTCAVCGHTSTHTVLISSSAFGASDLDTRPPPLLRLTLPLQVQCCPSCGYCARDVTRASATARAVVARPDYRAQLQDERFTYLANMFLCQSMILEAEGDYANAGWAALRAAWHCDDEAYNAAAILCRRRAAALFAEAQRRGHPFAETPEAEAAILADVLRRSGRFAEAQAVAAQRLAQHPSPTIEQILRFQHHLCRQRDTALYTVDDAQDWATGRPLGGERFLRGV